MSAAPEDPARRRDGAGLPAFRALYRLTLRNTVTLRRLLALLAVGGALVLVTKLIVTAIRANENLTADEIDDAVNGVVDVTGVGLLLPVVSLLFAGAALGTLREDKSLVYLWLTPTPRWLTPLAAALASFTVVGPTLTAGVAGSAAVAGMEGTFVAAVAVAAASGSLAYCCVFMAGSLVVRRLLVWGLAYVLIWEGAIASLEGAVGRVSIRRYTSSIVADWADVDFTASAESAVVALVVLGAVSVAAVAAAAVRLRRMTID
ncbi:MAG TPA: hypothetical protein DEP66_03725 [Acidimicrobiaceae bacterium]|nr:hypothetical protein [Acidimicrobiaceae bacterium]HCB37322.1 hypothetical protein [Acidimicrobiaceae bacterium]